MVVSAASPGDVCVQLFRPPQFAPFLERTERDSVLASVDAYLIEMALEANTFQTTIAIPSTVRQNSVLPELKYAEWHARGRPLR